MSSDANGLRSLATGLRYRIGQLTGGDSGRALIEASRAYARREGVIDDDRLFDFSSPGFRLYA